MAEDQTEHPILRTAILQAVIIAVVGLVCAFAVNTLRPDPFPWHGNRAGSASVRAASFPAISVEEAYTRYQQGTIRFVDARDTRDFTAGHLPGAVNIPAEKAETHLGVLRAPGLSGKVLVIYCSGPDCTLGSELAAKLAARGMKGFVTLPAGWSGWYGAGYPIEEGGAGK